VTTGRDRLTAPTHRFKRRGVPERLRLRFGSPSFPRRGVPYVLLINGQRHEGVLDEQGEVARARWYHRASITLGACAQVFSLTVGRCAPT